VNDGPKDRVSNHLVVVKSSQHFNNSRISRYSYIAVQYSNYCAINMTKLPFLPLLVGTTVLLFQAATAFRLQSSNKYQYVNVRSPIDIQIRGRNSLLVLIFF
jgi:hypothetical protein